MVKGLKAIILERFHPGSYLPMILVFTLVNSFFYKYTLDIKITGTAILLSGILILSAFFRLRLFDEIKDYETDLKINPTRPLARGIISISETKKVLAVLILFEVILSLYMGVGIFFVQCLVIGYSLLMYEEFFIGSWLSPRLTTYAVSHTFVSVLMGYSVAVSSSGLSFTNMSLHKMLFFLCNEVHVVR